MDECDAKSHNCSAYAMCNNTDASYNCICNSGYYGAGFECHGMKKKEKEKKKRGRKTNERKKIKEGRGVYSIYIYFLSLNNSRKSEILNINFT